MSEPTNNPTERYFILPPGSCENVLTEDNIDLFFPSLSPREKEEIREMIRRQQQRAARYFQITGPIQFSGEFWQNSPDFRGD